MTDKAMCPGFESQIPYLKEELKMSRSYKKNPVYSDGRTPTPKKIKRIANKKVRHTKNLADGKAYKKVFESWDIHDYISRWTWEDAKFKYFHPNLHGINWQEDYPTLKDFYKYWIKFHRNK